MTKMHTRTLVAAFVVIVLFAAAVPAAAGQAVERPISEGLAGYATGMVMSPSFPDGDTFGGRCSQPSQWISSFSGMGVYSHLGRVTWETSHCYQMDTATFGDAELVVTAADTLAAASILLMYVTRYDLAIPYANEAVEIYRTVSDEQGLAFALARAGHLSFSVGDVPAALGQLQESLEICGRIGYDEGTAWPLTLLAQARLWTGDGGDEVRGMLEEGRRRFIATGDTFGQVHANMFIPNAGPYRNEDVVRFGEESLELADEPGADPLIRPVALHNLAFGVWHTGDQERARGLNRLSARTALEMGVSVSSGMAFLQAGFFAAHTGNTEAAAILFGAGEKHFVMQMPPFYTAQLQPGIETAKEALGEDRYRLLYEQGSLLNVEEATGFLLGE